ncbi:MAG: hypothetical protein K2Q01_10600, partial [Rickettsiales bacterium]|nr:hypothetical protein [Rickettsiales bacterium]
GLDFLFEPLGVGLLDWMANHIKAHGKPFGFGGIATMHSGELPAERILAEHVRLGSSCVILSSRFCKDIQIENAEGRKGRIYTALSAMHAEHHAASKRTLTQQHEDAVRTAAIIRSLADKARTRTAF